MFNLSERATDKEEIIDSFDLPRRVANASYSFMEEVNRYYGGSRAITSFLKQEIKNGHIKKTELLRLLDLGSGSCDIPRQVIKWGKKNGIKIKYTCLEQHPAALKLAREKNQKNDFCLIETDLLAYEPDRQYDYVTASMVMHHFTFKKMRAIIERYSRWSRQAVVINDLQRQLVFYWLTWLRTLITSPENRHDALLSVRKGFLPEELRQLGEAIGDCSVEVKKMFFFRLRAVIRFEKEI